MNVKASPAESDTSTLPMNGASSEEHISTADLPMNPYLLQSVLEYPGKTKRPRLGESKKKRQVRLRSAQKQSAKKSITQTVTRPAAPLPTNHLLIFLLPA